MSFTDLNWSTSTTSSETAAPVRRRSASTAAVTFTNARRTSAPVRSSSSEINSAPVAEVLRAGIARWAAGGVFTAPRRTSSSNFTNSCGSNCLPISRRMISIASRCEKARL